MDNDWKHVFKGLKKYRTDGSEYVYSVREEKIDGYTTEYGDNTVINSYTGGDKVSVKGTKTWIDPEGTTHPTITIELYREADGIDKTFVKSRAWQMELQTTNSQTLKSMPLTAASTTTQ